MNYQWLLLFGVYNNTIYTRQKEGMSKKTDWADLGIPFLKVGISLRDMATIWDSDKKLTRGAKNQLKISASEK